MKTDSQIPRGIEVLVKKASVDSSFCNALITKRADAANDIGLTLGNAETAMLKAIPEAQLIGIIRKTKVSPKSRTAFMGYIATAMLATLGVTAGYAETSEDTEAEESDSETISTSEDGKRTVRITMKARTPTLGIRPDSELQIDVSVSTRIISISGVGSDDEKRYEEAINRVIDQRKSAIEYHYKKHKKSNPDLPEGIIVYSFDIIDDGSVTKVIVESDEIRNEGLSSEIATSIRGWKFAPAFGEVTVVVSFEFSDDE